jgi:LmbE family N-acetylglucosaminyl deacetylase
MLRTISSWIYRSALPNPVRVQLRLLQQLMKRDWQPVVADPPKGKRILVVAPHMDDEVFGCGGTLARAVMQGSKVKVVFLTDGRLGYSPELRGDLPQEEIHAFEQRLVKARKHEARRAGEILGFCDASFLDLPDGRAAYAVDGMERLRKVISEFDPDTVFLPFATDQHPDHWAANKLLIKAGGAARLGSSVQCWGYEVWTPLVANTFVDVTNVMGQKEEAMLVYSSQNSYRDYARAITSLNAYRSLAAGIPRGHVEAYFVESFARYRELFLTIWP